MRGLLGSFLAMAVVLAGCSGAPAPAASVVLSPDGEPVVPGVSNYTTPHPGGEPFTRTYAGTLTSDEAANSQSIPLGASAPNFETCCSMDWIDVTDLLTTDQLVALRLTLTWTNGQADRAGLDVATCLPWACWAFNYGPDESQQEGPHTDVLTLISSGRQEFQDMGMAYQVGVRYTNAVVPNGLPYTIQVEAHPVGDGLAPVDPYLVQVAEGANVTAELVGPYEGEGVRTSFMVYGADDRPAQWIELAGEHGSRHPLPLAAGTHVLLPFDVNGGFARLSADLEPASLRVERLREEFGMVEVAQVTDAQEHAGAFTYQADPGSIDPFPLFVYGEGVAAQDLFGVSPDDLGGAAVTLTSSSGLVAAVDQRQLSARTPLGTNCLQCGFAAEYNPSNYIDDDGAYDIAWSSRGGTGTFVLFTAKYVR